MTPEEKANVTERIKSINQFATIIESQNSVVDVSKILGLSAFSLTRALDIDPGFLEDGEHQHDSSVTSVGFHFEGDMNMAAVEMYIQELLKTKGTDLFRYKGVLSIKGLNQKFLFQGVHMLFGNVTLLFLLIFAQLMESLLEVSWHSFTYIMLLHRLVYFLFILILMYKLNVRCLFIYRGLDD